MAEGKKRGANNLKRQRESLRAMSVEDLQKKLAEDKEHLMRDRFRHATAALENTASLKTSRRLIARVETILREKTVGVSK